MNGESSNTWTFAALREYLLRVVTDLEKAMHASQTSQEKAILSALAAVNTATTKAEKSAEEWRRSANEWRDAMDDRERRFMPRAEFEANHRQLMERLDKIDGWRTTLEAKKAGSNEVWGYLAGAIGLFGGFAVALLK